MKNLSGWIQIFHDEPVQFLLTEKSRRDNKHRTAGDPQVQAVPDVQIVQAVERPEGSIRLNGSNRVVL